MSHPELNLDLQIATSTRDCQGIWQNEMVLYEIRLECTETIRVDRILSLERDLGKQKDKDR